MENIQSASNFSCLGHQEVMASADPVEPRSHIDEMIAQLAQRQNSVDEPGPSGTPRAGPSAGRSTPARNSFSGGTPAGMAGSSGGPSGNGSNRNNSSPRQGTGLTTVLRSTLFLPTLSVPSHVYISLGVNCGFFKTVYEITLTISCYS